MSSQDNPTAPVTPEQPEEQAVTILLIAHKQNQFAAAAAFLTRRGIPCTIKGNIKDGIAFVQKQKPMFVFLSWNLPNANTVKTYQLFTKNFKVDCIVFAEKTDGKTSAEIANSRLPQTMQAPVSGPALYMRVQKLIKAKQDALNGVESDAQDARDAASHEKDDDKVVLKSSKKNTDKNGFVTLTSDKKADKPGMINFQGAKYSEDDIEDQNVESDGSENDISAYLNEMSEDTETSSVTTTTSAAKSSVFENGSQNTTNTKDFDIAITGNGGDDMEIDPTKKKTKDYGSVTNIAKSNDGKGNVQTAYEISKRKDALILESDAKAKGPMVLNFEPRAESKIQSTLLFEKTKEALKSTTREIYENYEKVKVVSKAKVINIHSPRFRGYLLLVVPMYFELERSLFLGIKEKIKDLLKLDGEELTYFEDLSIDIEQVDFVSWCQEHAEFFIQSADKNNEVICAYFPLEPSMPKVDEESEKMAAIETKDLTPQTMAIFDLFIHLPKNNKFLKYLKTGDTITTNHTQKFEDFKVKNLHIKKDEVKSFKEYFAANQLKDKTTRKKKAA